MTAQPGSGRVDGYPSHEDAAAGYETWVGIFRMAIRDARTAIDAGLPAQAAQLLADAEAAYVDACLARLEAHRPAMRAAGLDYAPDGTVVLAAGTGPGSDTAEHTPDEPAVGNLLLQPRGALAVALLNEGAVNAGVLRRADELLAGGEPLPDGVAGRLRAMADAGNPGAAQVLARQEEA